MVCSQNSRIFGFRPVLIQLLGVFVLLVVASCGQKIADLQDDAVSPDTQLFETGMKFLEKHQHIKARLSFQTLINTYGDSEYAPQAFMAIADSFRDEGRTENLLQAANQYNDFIIFYPTHEMADDAQMKRVSCYVALMKPYDRDSTYARQSVTELKRMIENYPDSELTPYADDLLHEVEEVLALSSHSIGNFYFNRKSYLASEGRYESVAREYPNFSLRDETLFRRAQSLEGMGRPEQATPLYQEIARGYPFSSYYDRARDRLVLLEQDVPSVDPALAEKNEANIPIGKGFSVLDPIRSVFDVFAGRKDPYLEAKRRAEERRARIEDLEPVERSMADGND